jgi:hypothetical protein
LENEMRAFSVDKELGSTCIVAWNHQEFEVPYHCLNEEIKIGETQGKHKRKKERKKERKKACVRLG